MSLLDSFKKGVTETAKAAAKKSTSMVEIAKLNMSIGAEEDKIEKTYFEIGEIVYNRYTKGEEIPETFMEYCEKIKAYEENIKIIKEKILELKDLKSCSGCGAEINAEDAYCSKCGTKQEIICTPSEEDKENKE